jgi:hypothetical protein
MALRLDPFRTLVGIHFPSDTTTTTTTEPPPEGPWWRITQVRDLPELEINYVGESDSTVATSGLRAHHEFYNATVYTDLGDAQTAFNAIPLSERRYDIYRLDGPDATTEPPNPFTLPITDPAWINVEGRNGWLRYDGYSGRKIGTFGGYVADVDCPPEEELANGSWVTAEHADNFYAWQDSLLPGAIGSWTVYFRDYGEMGSGTQLYCTPGHT